MSNAHTYDKTSESGESKQQDPSMLSQIIRMFLTVFALLAILDFCFFYFAKDPSQWETIGLISLHVLLFTLALFCVTIMDGWREAWKDIKGLFHG